MGAARIAEVAAVLAAASLISTSDNVITASVD